MKWIDALQIYNEKHNNKKFCVPKKGTQEYYEVQKIMEQNKPTKKTEAVSKLEAVIKSKQTPKFEKPKKNTKLLDLPDNVLDIIGDKVKKDNKTRVTAELEKYSLQFLKKAVKEYHSNIRNVRLTGISNATRETIINHIMEQKISIKDLIQEYQKNETLNASSSRTKKSYKVEILEIKGKYRLHITDNKDNRVYDFKEGDDLYEEPNYRFYISKIKKDKIEVIEIDNQIAYITGQPKNTKKTLSLKNILEIFDRRF